MSDLTTLRATFTSESAAYRNTFGWYNSVTGVGGILFSSIEAEGYNPTVVGGVSYADFTVNSADVGNIQFFLISNGGNLNKDEPDDLTGPIKVIKLSDGSWAVADVDANGNVITKNGKPDLLKGAGANALFTETSKNAGGVDYASSTVGSQQTSATLAGDTANGATGTIAWEDLVATKKNNGTYTKPGDADYNDAVFQISVVSSNRPPVANADVASVSEDAAATTINVLANDTDPDAGSTLRVTGVNSTGLLGTVAIGAGGLGVIYTPASSFQSLRAGQTATETFTYTVADQNGATSTATTTVTVVGANDAPVVTGAATGNAIEDGIPSILNALAKASDVDAGTTLSIINVPLSLPAGVTYNAATHSFTLDPSAAAYQSLKAGVTTTVSVSYGVSDGTATTPATASWTITGTNDAPVVSGAVTGTATEDGGSSTLDALAKASDVDAGTTLAVVNVPLSLPAGVSYTAATHSFTLDPSVATYQSLQAGVTTTVSVSYGVSDGTATTPASVSWTVTGTNDGAVIGAPTSHDVLEDSHSTTLSASGMISVTDADQGEAFFQNSVVSASGNLGSLLLASDGSYTYSVANGLTQYLAANATKTDTFTVTSLDGTTKDVTFDIHGVQDKPVLGLANTSGNADSSIPLDISVSLVDVGSTAAAVEIQGVPSTFYTLNHGFQSGEGGSWFVPVTDLAGLALVPVHGQIPTISFTLKVVATSIDGSSQATSTGVIDVDVTSQIAQTTGRIVDGYIAGATVFADANDNGLLDDGEARATTNADGSFTLVGGSGPLVSFGGTDVSTGVQFHGILKAPEGSTVITPLTTLIVALAVSGVTVTEAANQVAAAFGFDPNVDLTTFDPIPTALTNDSTATAILSAAIQVQSTVAQISAVGSSPGAVFLAIADAIAVADANAGTVPPFDLSTSDTVQSVVSGAGVTGDAAAIVIDVVSAANESIQTATNVIELAQAGQVAQGAASEQLAQLAEAIANGSPDVAQLAANINQTFVTDLSTQISNAVVGDVDGALLGTLGNDVLVGLGGNDSIDGLDGNDQISGGGGNDLLFGGAGKDFLTGVAGDDLLDGGSSFDRAVYTDAAGGITVNLAVGTASGAGVGSDTLSGIEGIVGSNFADSYVATGYSGSTGIPGTPTGFNEFEGLGGNDAITGTVNSQGAALTRISYVSATAGVTVDIAAGTATGDASVGTDTFTGVFAVFGSGFDDTLRGSNNGFGTVEIFEGRAGNDLIDGRGGFDRADYLNDAATTSGITVNLAAGTVTGDATVGTDTLRSIEAVRGTNFADTYVATGFSGTSTNAGSSGTFNEFTGGGGNDSITGNGNTRISFNNATAGVTVDIAAGTATGDASVGSDTFTAINAVMGSVFNDTLSGSAGNETFFGLAGDDFIDGRGGFDVASYNNIYYTTGGVSINFAAGTGTGDAAIGTDTLRSIEGVQGTNFADSFDATSFGAVGFLNPALNNVGNNGTFNQFEGLGGNDTITGNGNTRLLFNNATGGVTIDLAAGTATGDASVGTDTFSGVNSVTGSNLADTYVATGFTGTAPFGPFNLFEGLGGNDTITGNGNTRIAFSNATASVTVNLALGTASGNASVGNDTITGGVNSVQGSNFSDTIIGDSGSNILIGGGGGDTFGYATGGGSDLITDFNRAQGDRIDVTGVSGIFGIADIQSRASASGGNTVIDFGNGNTLTLIGVTLLQSSDFVFPVVVNGTAGVDILTGTSQADVIFGLAGNDLLQGLQGNDLLDGGTGFDRAVYTDATGGVAIDLAAGTASGAGVGSDTLIGIEGVVGSNFTDTFVGTGFNGVSGIPGAPTGMNDFEGMGGDDVITGFINAQGAALTRISYVSATAGVTVDIAAGTATGDASVGTDTFSGVFTVFGSGFDDTLRGSNNASGTVEIFDGRAGNDLIDGRGGFDRADYVNDPATTSGISINLAVGTVIGDATVGTDTLRSIESVRGTNFADTYNAVGFSGASTNVGSNGTFNEFLGAGGNDNVTGNGNTRITFTNATAGVTVDIAAGTATGDASVGSDTFTGVNAVMGSVFGDTLSGSAGNETFTGLAGDDVIDGRGGFDTVSFNNIYYTTGGVSIDLAAGIATGDASIGTDTLRSIEGLIGTNVADTFDATNYGAAGFLNPAVNNVGSNGMFNRFEGLAGDDVITGNGNTRLAFFNATTGVTVDLAAGIAAGDASVGTDTFTGVNGASGSNFDDTYIATGFTGTGPASSFGPFNNFEGLAGNDTITGNGSTQIYFFNATGGVTVNLAAGTVDGNASVGHDTITGGVNSVVGTNFNDTIIGGIGNEILSGGLGADTFGYATGGGADFITDFTQAQSDRIDLTGVGGVYSLSDIQSRATQDGSNTVITFTPGNSITLQNVDVGSLVASDFIFAANSAPTDIVLSSSAVAENSAGGTVVGSLSALDPDAGDTATFTLTDNAGGLFAIDNGNLVVAGALDYEAAASHQVTVRVTDAVNHTYDKIFTINVTDVLEGITVNGDADANSLIGTAGPDTLNGLAGNDLLQGLAGNDLLDGGTGFDRAVYTDATGGVAVDLAAGTASGTGVGSDTLTGIEGIIGSNFADTFVATGFSGSSEIPGAPTGMNDFEGMGGDDVITGTVNSQGAALTRISYVNATAGVTVDIAAGTASGDASVGNDTFSGVFVAFGSGYDDTLRGSNNGFGSVEIFEGRAGADLIDGRGGFDRADYFNDPATTSGINVNLSAGTVTGDATVGTDTLRSIESVRGTNFADTYNATGFNGASTNAGSSGTFNEFIGGGGNDVITGNGNTRISFNNATAGVTVDIVAGTATGDASTGSDTFTGVNAVMGSVFADSLSGSAGSETFTGLAGDDVIDGRGGFDTVSFNNIYYTTGGVSVNFAAGTATGDASIGTDTFRSIESIQGTNFADSFDATNFGAFGFLNPGVNNVGNNGTFNQFEGLAGNDTITGNGNTRLLFNNATGGVTADLVAGTATGDASVGTDTFSGVNGVLGSNFADTFVATGFTGNGPAGSFGPFTFFEGLGGNDTVTGNGSTRIAFLNATAGVTVNLALGTATGNASVGSDIVSGVGSVQGSNFNDTLTGDIGRTSFVGAGGNDTIDGGDGADMAIFTGLRSAYTILQDTPSVGLTRVTDLVGARDGVDTLSNVEMAQFSDGSVLLASGTESNPIDVSSNLFFGPPANSLTTLTGTNNDFLAIGFSLSGHQIDLGAGTNDTVSLALSGGYSLNLLNVEKLSGSGGDDFASLVNQVDGMTVDLGGGNDSLSLANGSNTLSVLNVESIRGSDFDGGNPSDDSLTLLTNVSNLSLNLGDGTNTLNLAAGSNSLDATFGVNAINGSASGDTLTLNGGFNIVVDLGGGQDTLNLDAPVFEITVNNIETVNGSDGSDNIVVANTTGSTTVTGGLGVDSITASAGQDNFHFASASESPLGAGDQVSYFDAASDNFVFSNMSGGPNGFTGPINFIDTDFFSGSPGSPQSEARLEFSGGQTFLQIDVNGDGSMDGSDIEISLSNLIGNLNSSNFTLLA